MFNTVFDAFGHGKNRRFQVGIARFDPLQAFNTASKLTTRPRSINNCRSSDSLNITTIHRDREVPAIGGLFKLFNKSIVATFYASGNTAIRKVMVESRTIQN